MTDGEKEQIKLRATYANNVAVALVAVGGLTQAYALMAAGTWNAILGGAIVLAGAGSGSWGLHTMAQKHLKKLDD